MWKPSALTLAVPMSWPAMPPAQECAGRDQLRAHSNECRKEVIKVTDRVYVAGGCSLGNAILVRKISANARNYLVSAAQCVLTELPPQ